MKRIAVVLLCAWAGVIFAQAPATKAAEKPAEKKAAPATDANKAKDATAQPAPAADASKPAKDASATPQRFTPSEQVRPDFDVSFPVDI